MEETLIKIKALEAQIKKLEKEYLKAPEEIETEIETEIERLENILADINSDEVQEYRWKKAGCPDLDYGCPENY